MSTWDDPAAHIRALEAENKRLRAQKAELMAALATSNESLQRAGDAMRARLGMAAPRPTLRVVDGDR